VASVNEEKWIGIALIVFGMLIGLGLAAGVIDVGTILPFVK